MLDAADFELSAGDKASGLWLRLSGHMTTRLDAARRRNDNALPPDETASLRGEIRTLKALLALGEDRQSYV
jgi:hypothetical protein